MVGPNQIFRRVENLRHRMRTCPHGIVWVAAVASTGFALLGAECGLAATPLPIVTSNVILSSTATIQTYSIDLSTMPTRPVLVVEVTPPLTHANMQLEIELTNVQAPFSNLDQCPGIDTSILSQSGPGVATLAIELFKCGPYPAYWATATADIKLRALSFGTSAPPAAVSVVIRAETRPATGTMTQQVDPPFVQQLIQLDATQDTVLYENTPSRSNGAGDFLWAGHKGTAYPAGNRHALLAFDVNGAIRPTSLVDDAELTLEVSGFFGSGGNLALYQIAGGPGASWTEGDANGANSEFEGEVSTSSAATWNLRSSTVPWLEPGGDLIGPPLEQVEVFQTGLLQLQSFALVNAVQDMVSNGGGANGFLVRGPRSIGVNLGIQFASSENVSGAQNPLLQVWYTPTEIFESGSIQTNAVTFINEGQNFRWIYDLDHDNVLVTNIGGVCEVVDTSNEFQLPYTYRYQGTPGYSGVDCCTWRIDSQTGVVGTGQALFFHNLDASNPANMPPDGDQDGIRNLCDNCPSTPNGPLRGTCLIGAIGAVCRSNQECGTGGVCNLSQQDSNGDFVGNVCGVPEPGFAAGLAAGLALTAVGARRRTRR